MSPSSEGATSDPLLPRRITMTNAAKHNGKNARYNASATDGTEGVPRSDSTVRARSPNAHARQAAPSTIGSVLATDRLVRHDRSKKRPMHSAPIDISNAATPHPSTGTYDEPARRTISDMTYAATIAPEIAKVHHILGTGALRSASTWDAITDHPARRRGTPWH